jgi:hypothetical protein
VRKTVIIIMAALAFSGCATMGERIAQSDDPADSALALRELEGAAQEDRLYAIRDLSEIVLGQTGAGQKTRAALGLLKLAEISAKEGDFETALDTCWTIYNAGRYADYAAGHEEDFAKPVSAQFGNTLASILPPSADRRKKFRWTSLGGLFLQIIRRSRVKYNKVQHYVIKEAVALSALDAVAESGSILQYRDFMNKNARTGAAAIAGKMIQASGALMSKKKYGKTAILEYLMKYHEKASAETDAKLVKWGAVAGKYK